jgi:hypothetical protein
MKATAADLEQVSRLVARESGVVLGEEKDYLIRSLLAPLGESHGNTLRALLTLGSDSAANLWQQSALDLSGFAGQTIQLKFVAQTDETLVTDFFIDDVEVQACTAISQGFRLFLPMVDR